MARPRLLIRPRPSHTRIWHKCGDLECSIHRTTTRDLIPGCFLYGPSRRMTSDGETEAERVSAAASKSVLERWCVLATSQPLFSAEIKCRAVLWVGFLGWGIVWGPREAVTHWNSFTLFPQDRVTTERTALSFALWMPPEEMTTMTGTWHCLRYLRSHSGVVGWQGLLGTSQLSIRLASLPVPSAFSSLQPSRLWFSWPFQYTLPSQTPLQPYFHSSGPVTFAILAAPHQGDYFLLPSIPRASPSPWLCCG